MQMEHPSRAAGAQGCVFCVQSVLGCVCSSPGNKTLGNGSIVCSGSVLSPHSLVPFFLTPRGNQTPPAQSQPRFPTFILSLGSTGQKFYPTFLPGVSTSLAPLGQRGCFSSGSLREPQRWKQQANSRAKLIFFPPKYV